MKNIIYTLLTAIACMVLVLVVDAGITRLFDKKSILQKNYIKMPLSSFVGILVFLMISK